MMKTQISANIVDEDSFFTENSLMILYKRKILPLLLHTLNRGKSILLLGARQTGKTTLIKEEVKPDINYSLIQPENRQRYEKSPSLIADEILTEIRLKELKNPIVAIDEIQKVPILLDVVQDLIDQKIARFVLTGSSARKLKHGRSLNLLPGRVVVMHLDPLLLSEMNGLQPTLENLLLFGSLPGIINETDNADKNKDLDSYVKTYLEEEIRAEAIVRNVGHFAKFLYLSANESGRLINFSQLSQTIGVSHSTIAAYFQILEDCLIIKRIEALTMSQTRQRLSKAAKYIFFDLGVRRLCAEEGMHPPLMVYGQLFEQWVGLELMRRMEFVSEPIHLRYWRDHSGPEIDYVIEYNHQYIPIEVKWTEQPTEKDCRHLSLFLEEYEAPQGYIICRTPKPYFVKKNILVLPWQELDTIKFE